MKRRSFIRHTSRAAAATIAAPAQHLFGKQNEQKKSVKLPRRHGFNLLEKFQTHSNKPFVENDFKWIRDFGFDFVRLPMDYRCWTDKKEPYRQKEKVIAEIDRAVQYGQKYHIHVNLNLHRAPGYTVARPPEELNLWESEEAQKQFDFQWSSFAERYKGISSKQLSFDLVNEPARIPPAKYVKVAKRVVAAIRKKDPSRLIIADGLSWGREPVYELAGLGIGQSTRGYDPMQISHWKASWVNGERWPKPTWPLKQGKKVIDKKALYEKYIKPWKKLEKLGGGVHVGECGCYNKTPHATALAWFGDFLSLWKDAGWGWALWNFRGSFGILDSGRTDVAYEEFHGHKLDRKLLSLLQKYST